MKRLNAIHFSAKELTKGEQKNLKGGTKVLTAACRCTCMGSVGSWVSYTSTGVCSAQSMIIKYLQILLWVVLFTSCTPKQVVPTINLLSFETTEITLSKIADSIVYYPIIIEKECRTPKHIELLTHTIWVSYYLKDLSDQKGCLFDRTGGNLLNQISFGPVLNKNKYAMDSYATNSCFVFNNENWLTTLPATNTKARSYTLDVKTGKEIEAVPFSMRDIYSSGPQRINDSTFLMVTDLIGFTVKNSVRPNYSIQWYDAQMKPIKEDLLTDSVYLINRHKFINLLKDKIYLHADCTSTIYELSRDKKPKPIYHYDLGKHTPCVATNGEFLAKGQYNQYYNSSYYNLHNSMIAENFIFGAFDYRKEIYNVLYNRKTEQTWIFPTNGQSDGRVYSYKEGIKNDLDGGLDFWPKNVSRQGEIYTWYHIEDLKNKVIQDQHEQMKNSEAAQRLKKMLENLPEDVNYIVAVLKETK